MTLLHTLYYGHPQPLPAQLALRAGPLALLYEAGDLRYIRLGNVEIIRRIYCAVRDHNWGTIPPRLSNERVEANADSFKITYDAVHCQNNIAFTWQGAITGEKDGTITFALRGQAHSTFRRNRIGFCVLHPMSCAGNLAKIEHVDGSTEESSFPTTIAPQKIIDGHPWPVVPFDNLRALSHQALPNLWAEVRFAGDTFEMEDQRNWTDGSYKTYCTPLALPFPVEIEAGTEIMQTIRLSLHGPLPQALPGGESDEVTISIGSEKSIPMPQIGLGGASHGQTLTPQAIERLKALHLSHLRVDLNLNNPGYKTSLRQATDEARALGISLEIAIFVTDAAQDELTDLAAALPEIRPPVLRWLVFHQQEKTTSTHWVKLVRQHLADYAAVPIGAGSNAYFTEINAQHPPTDVLDFITYSINPQVHAFDNASLVETLAAQADTITSARQFAAGKPVAVSPVTLKPRFNPNATGPQPQSAPGQLPPQVDVRQSSLFGLAWTLGSLKYLAESGAVSVTFYETTGWRGVMEQADGCPLPGEFASIPGGVYPLYHLFADAAEARRVIPLRSNRPLKVEALLLESDQGRIQLLANLTPIPQTVVLTQLPAHFQLRRINETNVLEAMEFPETFRQRPLQIYTTQNGTATLELMPFEMLRLNL